MSGLIGKKIGMTSLFDADGKQIPCTVIEAGPCVVTQVRTIEKDGYEAIQLAFGEKKESHTTKAMKGHFAKANTTPKRLTFQVPMQYCSLQHWTFLPSAVPVTTGCYFCFGPIPSFFLELFLH